MSTTAATSIGSVDRPDILRETAKKHLSFKEVKESFFKFLLRANIPFSNEHTRLSILNDFESKVSGEVHTVESAFYNATCKLEGITVDKAPIYIIVLNTQYRELPFRQRNKLLTLKKNYNLVVFDKDDWSTFDLAIFDKAWLDRLSKSATKRWVRALFKKIVQLGGKIESKYTLNEVEEHLDTVYSVNKDDRLDKLSRENRNLRASLFIALFSNRFKVTKNNLDAVHDLAALNPKAIKWVEKTLLTVIKEASLVNFKSKEFKKVFNKGKGVSESDKDHLISYLQQRLVKRGLSLTRINFNLFKIQSLDTFQEFTVHFEVSSKAEFKDFILGSKIGGSIKGGLISVVLTLPKVPSKLSNIQIYLLNKSKLTSKGRVSINSTLEVYNSKTIKVLDLCPTPQTLLL